MASPQVENGYTKIANELLEAYSKIRLSGEENQIFWIIIRKTYGFEKKEDNISLSQFVLSTGINKPNVCRALSNLIEKNMIIKNDNNNITNYRIQKDYTQWRPLSKKIMLSKKIIEIIKKDNKTVIKKDTYKRNKNTKETLTKPDDIKLTNLLIEKILENNPKSRVNDMTQKQKESWFNECRLLKNKWSAKDIEIVILFTQQDEFEKTVVLSMAKLRKRFDSLVLKAKREINKRSNLYIGGRK